MSAATQQMVAWLKAAVTPCDTTKQGRRHTTEHQQVVVLFDNTPPKTGAVTPVTPVTPQNSNLLSENTETTRTPAPLAVTPGAVTPCDTTKQGLCHTDKTGVLIGETPPKRGAVTPVTPVTPQNSNLLSENTETTRTPAPDLRSALPTPAPTPALTSSNGGSQPRPQAWFHLESSWRVASKAWQAHRNTCPTCQTSERTAATAGTGIRCKLGQRLHTAYEAALNNATGGYNP